MKPPGPPPPSWRRRLVDRLVATDSLQPLKFELAIARTRMRGRAERRRYAGQRGLQVNVGAGGAGEPGWVNVDVVPNESVTCLYDCRRSLPFEDSSVRHIFTEHFLEHLHYHNEVPVFLRECLRVLEPAGVIRVVVPDIGRYLRAYCDEGWERLEEIRGMTGDHIDPWFGVAFRTKAEVINFAMRQLPFEPHQYAYDAETLALALTEAGFQNVTQCVFGKGTPELLIDSPARRSESLYMEASKPDSVH